MKKRIRTHINIFLGAAIAMLGVGCHTQKKATEISTTERSEQTILLMYGVPAVEVDTTQTVEDKIPDRATEAEVKEDTTRHAVRVKYGVPPVRR